MTSRRGFLGALAALASLKVPCVEDQVKRIAESVSRAYAARYPTSGIAFLANHVVTYGPATDFSAALKAAYPPQSFVEPEVFHGSFRLGEKTRWAAMSDEARARVKACEKELETYYEGSSSERSPRRTED